MAVATTSEIVGRAESKAPFSMIEGQGLWTRLREQLSQAAAEFSRDPRAFLNDLFFDDDKDLQRNKRIRFGLTAGLLMNLALFGVIAVLGMGQIRPVVDVADLDKIDPKDVQWVKPTTPPEENKTPETTSNPSEMLKGKGDNGDTAATGGGGMGKQTPPKLGTPPQFAAVPTVMSPIAPSAPTPSLPMNPTLEGPPTPPPPANATIGSPTGEVKGSEGPGTNGGIGTGTNGGVGDKSGPGVGNKPAGTGGGELPGSPNGKLFPTGPVPWNLLRARYSDSTDIQWISRPRPIITPEAREMKVSGTVLLRATFNADGTITDIEIINKVDGMTESAIAALQRSRFRPATVLGKPITLTKVPVRINITTD